MKHAGIFVLGALSTLYIATILFLRGNDAWELLRAGASTSWEISSQAFSHLWLSVGWYTGISYSPKNSVFNARN